MADSCLAADVADSCLAAEASRCAATREGVSGLVLLAEDGRFRLAIMAWALSATFASFTAAAKKVDAAVKTALDGGARVGGAERGLALAFGFAAAVSGLSAREAALEETTMAANGVSAAGAEGGCATPPPGNG